ncbi:hypothetical protein MRY82_08305 [bacterium]|nr:hypothetical protein [bacterium]
MPTEQLKIKEDQHIEQSPYFIFLDALQNYLKLGQNASKNQRLIESLHDKLKAVPKFIIQFNFHKLSISYQSLENYTFDKTSPFAKLFSMGLYKIRILNSLNFESFNTLLSLLTASVDKTPIKTHQYDTLSFGLYFKKTVRLSFKSAIKKASKNFETLNIDVDTNTHIFSFLKTLKTYPETPKLRDDLETIVFALVKSQLYHDALILIESYTPQNYTLKNTHSLWSPNLITKTLHHLKFFKLLAEHEEACENLLSSIPSERFLLCFNLIEQFNLHPSKMIFIRYLARIHRGDSGFLQKIFNFSPDKGYRRIYKKSLLKLTYILNSSIDPMLIMAMTKQLGPLNKKQLLKLLLPYSHHQDVCAWLIENLYDQTKEQQHKAFLRMQNVKQTFVAQLLLDKVVEKKNFIQTDSIFKEYAYDTVLVNSPKLFTEHLQNQKLNKGMFYKIKHLDDYICLEKVLKKNQYFSKSTALKKIQKISQSFKIRTLKNFFTLLGLIDHPKK